MDDFKIELFESEYDISFPFYKSVEEAKCESFIKVISQKYNINVSNLESELMLLQSFYEDSNALDEFKLMDTLAKLEINPLINVYINWYRFKDIDELNLNDLDKYFYDIWFPSADDIDIFDENLNWILSIRHDGCITFIKHN